MEPARSRLAVPGDLGDGLRRVAGKGAPTPGIYVLLAGLADAAPIPTGRLGVVTYSEGWYAYVGSALGGLSARLRHHLRPHRRLHWHIDYLLTRATLESIVAARTHEHLECRLAACLAGQFSVWPGFGASDCRCRGHLFHCQARTSLLEGALFAIRAVGCEPEVVRAGGASIAVAQASRRRLRHGQDGSAST
ncbi:MAG: GIY-YIG nuclease family protein [Chloroflexi bacterium]|nr:GIY-YIG nuclease family protein [Chloroflexota bacterium]